MARKTTAKDLHNTVQRIEAYAKQLGLLPEDAILTLHIGNPSNGISPALQVYTTGADGQRRSYRGVDFLPTFWNGYKTTRKETWCILSATEDALRGVIRHTEEDQP